MLLLLLHRGSTYKCAIPKTQENPETMKTKRIKKGTLSCLWSQHFSTELPELPAEIRCWSLVALTASTTCTTPGAWTQRTKKHTVHTVQWYSIGEHGENPEKSLQLFKQQRHATPSDLTMWTNCLCQDGSFTELCEDLLVFGAYHSAVFHPSSSRVTLFGGQCCINGPYEYYNEASWTSAIGKLKQHVYRWSVFKPRVVIIC